MKRIVHLCLSTVLYMLILWGGEVFLSAQVFRPLTYEDYVRPLLEMQRAHNQAMSAINELSAYVVDVLGHDIDSQLRQEMNAELKRIDELAKQLSSNGYNTAINNGINTIIRDIQKDIANYNNRAAESRSKAAQEEAQRHQREASLAAEPEEWSGTGFALKNGYIVTNFHVVDRARSILVYGINGSMSSGFTASIVASDKVNDLAIIKISDSRFSGFGNIPYSIKNQMAEVGEDVWVLGYPLTQVLGNEIKLTNGIVSSRSGYQGDVATYQISAPVQPGNSGGPLFDSRGDIVGIVNAGVPGADNVGYAIKTLYLKSLVDRFSLSSVLPTANNISSLALKDQVKRVNNYVFLLICSTKGSLGQTSNSSYSSKSSTSSSISTNAKRAVSTSIRVNETSKLSVSDKTVTKWKSDDPSVVSVDASGMISGKKVGKTTIWATFSDGKLEPFFITVRDPNSSLRSISKTSNPVKTGNVAIRVGETVQLSAPEGKVSVWESDDSSVASVDSNGIVTGKKVGKTTVWARFSGEKLEPFFITVRASTSSQ